MRGHRFKNDAGEELKWAILLIWISGFAGSVLIGLNHQSIGPNQIHILFGPWMTLYGLGFIIISLKKSRFVGAIFRRLLFALLLILTGLPAILGFFSGNPRMQFPPYLPYLIQYFADWTKPGELIVSDMPWAVAWYADRGGVYLPVSLDTLTEYYNLQSLGAPIAGIYLTPVSRDLRASTRRCCRCSCPFRKLSIIFRCGTWSGLLKIDASFSATGPGGRRLIRLGNVHNQIGFSGLCWELALHCQFLAQVTEPQVLVIASQRLLRNFPEIEKCAPGG